MNNEQTQAASLTDQAEAPQSTTAPPSVQVATPAAPQRPSAGPRGPFVPREERERRRREALANLTVGEWREGKVTGIAAFGAFVDLGGVDGLVHVSQLGTGGFVERVEDVVQVGQIVRVRVAEVDAERGRVSLSMREPRPAGQGGAPRERTAGPSAPRAPRPASPPSAVAPVYSEPAQEQRHDRRSRGPDRNAYRDERPRRERSRRSRDADDEEWRSLRGDVRGYYSTGDEQEEEEPAPTTAEELVARFGRRGSTR